MSSNKEKLARPPRLPVGNQSFEQPALPLADIIGTVCDDQAEPYKIFLTPGDKLRIFNTTSIRELLEAIPGEKGKNLRMAYEDSKYWDLPEEDVIRLNRAIIRSFFATARYPKEVRFLPLMRPDGGRAKNSILVYPVALRNRST